MLNSWGGDPNTLPWTEQPEHPGTRFRHIGDKENGPWVVQLQWDPDTEVPGHWHECNTVYVINEGSISFGNDDEHEYRAGEVRWVRAGHFYGPEKAGPDGCVFTLIGESGDLWPRFTREDALGAADK